MKAAVLKGAREMVVEEIPTPEIGPDQVLVKIANCGICGSDVSFYKGGLVAPGTVMGHECSGTVAEVGRNVKDWAEGDRVALYGSFPCGMCRWCKRDQTHLCPQKEHRSPGGYAEYVSARPEMLLRLPENITLREAALIEPLANSYHCVEKAEPRTDDFVVVIGAGPIGLGMIVCLRLRGVKGLVVTETMPKRAEVAMLLGADEVLNPETDDVLARVTSLMPGGADMVFECVGKADTLQQSFDLVASGGKVVVMGVCLEPFTTHPAAWIVKEVCFQASFACDKDDMQRCLDLISEAKIDVNPLITDVVPLEALPDTFESLLKPTGQVQAMLEF